MSEQSRSAFEKAASEQRDKGILAESWYFLWQHKAWWLLPIVILLLLFGALLMLGQTAAAPFIYTLF